MLVELIFMHHVSYRTPKVRGSDIGKRTFNDHVKPMKLTYDVTSIPSMDPSR